MKSFRHFIVSLASWENLLLYLGMSAAAWAVPPMQLYDTPYLQLEEHYSLQDLGVGLDVAVSPEGNVFLSSASRPGLWRLDQDKRIFLPLADASLTMNGASSELLPTAMEVDGQGHIWVADAALHQLQILSPNGQALVTYTATDLQLDAPAALNRLGGNGMAVWDRKTGKLWSFAQGSITARQLTVAPQCLAARPEAIYCVQEDSQGLVKYQNGQITARFSLNDSDYPRIGDIALGPEGNLYLTDAANRRFLSLSAELQPRHRFFLYEPLFRTPTRFAFYGDNLWLIDEGREELLQFSFRLASTGLDHALLGEEYLALGHFTAALEEFNKALHLGHKDPEIHLLKGKALYSLKRYPDALAAFARAQSLRGISQFWQGNTLFRMGRYQEALQAFQAASGPDEDLIRLNEGQVLLALKEYPQAAMIFRQLLERTPGDPQARLGLARALLGGGSYADAIAVLSDLATDARVSRQARFYLGLAYLNAGIPEKALPLLEQAASEGPYFKDAFYALALTNQRLGRRDLAKRYEQRASDFKQQTERLDAYLLEDTP